jgi:hypothetical protein
LTKTPWLLSLATKQRGRVPTGPIRYDADQQIAVVEQAGELVPAVETRAPTQTKKADIEKGEDRKDRWWQS